MPSDLLHVPQRDAGVERSGEEGYRRVCGLIGLAIPARPPAWTTSPTPPRWTATNSARCSSPPAPGARTSTRKAPWLALNGLRISEALGADITAMGSERGHRTLTVLRKGGKLVTIPLAPRTARSLDLAIGERLEGPIFFRADGQRLDRHGAARIVRRMATRDAYTLDLRQYTAWCTLHGLHLFAARRVDIESFRGQMEAAGRARATVARRLCTIAGLSRYAVEEELLDHSRAAHVRRPA